MCCLDTLGRGHPVILRWTHRNCGTAKHELKIANSPAVSQNPGLSTFCWFSKMRRKHVIRTGYVLKDLSDFFSVFVLCKMMRFDVNVNPTLINVDCQHRGPTLGYCDINWIATIHICFTKGNKNFGSRRHAQLRKQRFEATFVVEKSGKRLPLFFKRGEKSQKPNRAYLFRTQHKNIIGFVFWCQLKTSDQIRHVFFKNLSYGTIRLEPLLRPPFDSFFSAQAVVRFDFCLRWCAMIWESRRRFIVFIVLCC